MSQSIATRITPCVMSLAVGTAFVSGCASPPTRSHASAEPPTAIYQPEIAVEPTSRQEEESSFRLRGTYESLTFGELTSDFTVKESSTGTEGTGSIAFEDVERDQLRLGFRTGGEKIGFYLDLLLEELSHDLSAFDEERAFDDMLGLEVGLSGSPIIADPVFVEYAAGISGHYGEGEFRFIDPSDGSSDSQDETLIYGEVGGEIGVGIDISGLRPSVGVRFSYMRGRFELEDEIPFEDLFGLDGTIESGDFDANNTGYYVGLEYRNESFPLSARAEALFGDIEGFTVSGILTF